MRFTADQLRTSFLTFLQERGHAILPSASLVAAGRLDRALHHRRHAAAHALPAREPHPLGRRLANAQKCLRTDDIEEVGDASHGTFFEMLGFWSLGDYWKPDSLRWTLEWFTEALGLEKERIAVTVFAGDDDAPRDDEAIAVWRSSASPTSASSRSARRTTGGGRSRRPVPAGQTPSCSTTLACRTHRSLATTAVQAVAVGAGSRSATTSSWST